MMLLKCCPQYDSKFGKLNCGHRTGKSQFSSQSQRRAIVSSVPAIVQLCSFHMLVKLCSKSFTLGFSSTGTKNFHIYKLGSEKAEEPEIKLPTSTGPQKKKGNSRKTSTSTSLTTQVFDSVDHNKLWKIVKEMETLDYFTCLLRNLNAGQEIMVQTLHGTTDWVQNWERSMTSLYIVTLLI